jgi:AraC-like DNA-binding protein
MTKIINIKSVAEVHTMLGIDAPRHPLITVVKNKPQVSMGIENIRIVSDLYFIALKENLSCIMQYGRNNYDYDEGTFVFIAPGQVIIPSNTDEPDLAGWTLAFHPDLLAKFKLGQTISNYSFFDYEANEALHISDKEKNAFNEIVSKIEDELHGNLDAHSMDIIIHNIETILKYSLRFYERQHETRTNLNQDYRSKFEIYINQYFDSNQQIEYGIPTLESCGEAMNMSGKYLSDLLKKETGKGLLEHIHSNVIIKAKSNLLSSNDTVSEVAYALGFKYPQHFSKLFKNQTGYSPTEYRKVN